jgi:hypothetical protein
MDDLTRLWTDLVARLSGPMSFRFILQPTMGLLFAALDGFKDAREGRPPYLWTIFTHREERRRLLKEGWRRIARLIVVAVVMDVVYQLRFLHGIYPAELIDIVPGFAVLPYLLLRGPFNRIARVWTHARGSSTQTRA